MKTLLLVLLYLQSVASLSIIVQRDTSAAHPQQFRTRGVQETYEVNTDHAPTIGASNKLDAIPLPFASTTTPIARALASSPGPISNNSESTVGHNPHTLSLARVKTLKPKAICIIIITVPIIIAVVILTILAFLIKFRIRHFKEATNRLSFHPEWMVQGRGPPFSIPSIAPHSQDLEEGSPDPAHVPCPMHGSSRNSERSSPHSVIYQIPLSGPRGPRPHAALPRSPLVPKVIPSRATSSSGLGSKTQVRSHSTHRQRAIADQLEVLQLQMSKLEQAGRNHGDSEIDEIRRKKVWLEEQLEGPWALGLTEVTPPGHDRYMSTS